VLAESTWLTGLYIVAPGLFPAGSMVQASTEPVFPVCSPNR